MSRPNLILALVVILTAAAGLVLTAGGGPSPLEDERAREFHRLVGGLGYGPAVEFEPCAAGFDPRLCPVCSQDVGPVPGGVFFCPHH